MSRQRMQRRRALRIGRRGVDHVGRGQAGADQQDASARARTAAPLDHGSATYAGCVGDRRSDGERCRLRIAEREHDVVGRERATVAQLDLQRQVTLDAPHVRDFALQHLEANVAWRTELRGQQHLLRDTRRTARAAGNPRRSRSGMRRCTNSRNCCGAAEFADMRLAGTFSRYGKPRCAYATPRPTSPARSISTSRVGPAADGAADSRRPRCR